MTPFSLISVFSGNMSCGRTLLLYLTHQIGLLTSTTALLTMNSAFHRHLNNKFIINQVNILRTYLRFGLQPEILPIFQATFLIQN